MEANMWNVYADKDGKFELVAEDCGSEENAWDVVEYLDNTDEGLEYRDYPLFVQFVKMER